MVGGDWSAPDGVTYHTKRACVVYVLATHQGIPNPQRGDRPEDERPQPAGARDRVAGLRRVVLVLVFAVSAALFARRPRVAERLA
jgi:hypothetical protein